MVIAIGVLVTFAFYLGYFIGDVRSSERLPFWSFMAVALAITIASNLIVQVWG